MAIVPMGPDGQRSALQQALDELLGLGQGDPTGRALPGTTRQAGGFDQFDQNNLARMLEAVPQGNAPSPEDMQALQALMQAYQFQRQNPPTNLGAPGQGIGDFSQSFPEFVAGAAQNPGNLPGAANAGAKHFGNQVGSLQRNAEQNPGAGYTKKAGGKRLGLK